MERQLAKRRQDCGAVDPFIWRHRSAGAAIGPDVTPAEREVFPSLVARRVIPGAGHFLPREKPEAVSSALLELLQNGVVRTCSLTVKWFRTRARASGS